LESEGDHAFDFSGIYSVSRYDSRWKLIRKLFSQRQCEGEDGQKGKSEEKLSIVRKQYT